MRDEFVDFNPQIPFLRQAETYRSEHAELDLLCGVLCALCSVRWATGRWAMGDGRLGHQVLLRGAGQSARKRVVQNNCDDGQQAPEHERILCA